MAGSAQGLLDQIEQDVLNNTASLADALRKVVVLGGRSGSVELHEWASRELRGYKPDESLPVFRIVAAPLKINGIHGNFQYTGQTISSSALPDFAQEHIKEEVALTMGIGEIEAMVSRAQSTSGVVQLAPSQAHLVVRYMNSESGPFQAINELYWSVSVISLAGVVDQVRTALAELLAELRHGTSRDATPTAEVATQAVNVAVYGRGRVNLNTLQSSGGSTSAQSSPQPAESTGVWSKSKKIGAAVVGLATIAGTAIALAQWQDWSLPGV